MYVPVPGPVLSVSRRTPVAPDPTKVNDIPVVNVPVRNVVADDFSAVVRSAGASFSHPCNVEYWGDPDSEMDLVTV